jgi:gliding motility associated protien GldN
MKNLMKYFVSMCSILCACHLCLAQAERDEFGYNINSVRPIHENNQLYRVTLWSRIDGREKQNQSLYAKEQEITKTIIEAVKAGILRPFANDSLTTRMSYEDFISKLTIATPEEDLEDTGLWMSTDSTEDWGIEPRETPVPVAVSNEYFPKQLYLLELKEDLVFDKGRSRTYYDVQAITIMIPAEINPKGIDEPLATFSYKELVSNVFQNNAQAVWYNNQNEKQNHNLADAIELRLFSSHILKFSNAQDAYIEDIYGSDKNAIIASMQLAHKLVENDTEIWEY